MLSNPCLKGAFVIHDEDGGENTFKRGAVVALCESDGLVDWEMPVNEMVDDVEVL